jgi:hypothetical protein
MRDIFTTKWFIATVAGWIVLIILDELTYYWWKDLNPGSLYSGILVKHPTQQPGTATS